VTTPQLLLKVAGIAKIRDYLLTEIHKVYKSQGVDINDKHIELVIRRMVNNVRVTDPGDSEFFPNQLIVLEEFREELRRLEEENRGIRRQREALLGQILGEDLVSEEGEEIAAKGDEITGQVLQAALQAGVEALALDRGGELERVRIREKRLPVGERVLLRISKAALETKSWLAAASFQRTTTVLAEAALRGSEDPLESLKPNVIIGRLVPAGTGFHQDGADAEGDGSPPAAESPEETAAEPSTPEPAQG
jgi:DNA-directed RNA polymerase subunit beta'